MPSEEAFREKRGEYRRQYFHIVDEVCNGKKSVQSVIEEIREFVRLDTISTERMDILDLAISLIDTNATISFFDKHFTLTGEGDHVDKTCAEIIKRGGIIHPHVTKKNDYLVVFLDKPTKYEINRALEWRCKGANNYIISDYQLWQAIRETDR